jgi:hypothetical protein
MPRHSSSLGWLQARGASVRRRSKPRFGPVDAVSAVAPVGPAGVVPCCAESSDPPRRVQAAAAFATAIAVVAAALVLV